MSGSIEYGGYGFARRAQEWLLVVGSSKLLNFYSPRRLSTFSEDEFGKAAAWFRGALLHLFGPPLESSDLAEEAFEYVIEAQDPDENSWILTAYQGATGPAIGGMSRYKSECRPAAEALAQLIAATAPDDFEATVYHGYGKGRTRITYGCRDGECFYREVLAEDTLS